MSPNVTYHLLLEAKTAIEQFAPENRPKLPKRKRASIPNVHVQVLCCVSFRGLVPPNLWGEMMDFDQDIIVYNWVKATKWLLYVHAVCLKIKGTKIQAGFVDTTLNHEKLLI